MTIKPTSDAVAVTQAGTFERVVSHDEALEAAKALIDGHFNNKGGRGVYISIPAQPDNTDVLLVDYIKQQRALSRLASTRPMTEDVAGLVDDFTSALRLGVEDDVTIPFDLAVRIHAALSAKPEAGESARYQPQREAVLEEAVKQALLQVEKYAEFFCEEDFDPLIDQLRSALTTPAPAVSRDDQALLADICDNMAEVLKPLPGIPAAADPDKERLRLARNLARALARRDRTAEQLRRDDTAVQAAFGPFAAGRRLSLEEAREQLTSIGLLKRRKVWE